MLQEAVLPSLLASRHPTDLVLRLLSCGWVSERL